MTSTLTFVRAPNYEAPTNDDLKNSYIVLVLATSPT
jgi:hypothetical protein